MRTRTRTVAAVDFASVQKRIAALTAIPSMSLYNPSPDWIAAEVSGQMFYIPPDLKGVMVEHPVDCMGIKQNTRRQDVEDNDLAPQMVEANGELPVGDYITSRGIKAIGVEHIVSVIVANYNDRGVTLLDPDQRKAEKEKKAAFAAWEKFRRTSAQAIVDAWSERVAQVMKTPGAKAPTPPQKVREAREFLDSMASSGDAFEFNCKYGDYSTNDKAKYSRHMKVAHDEVQKGDDGPPILKRSAKSSEAASAA